MSPDGGDLDKKELDNLRNKVFLGLSISGRPAQIVTSSIWASSLESSGRRGPLEQGHVEFDSILFVLSSSDVKNGSKEAPTDANGWVGGGGGGE